MRFLCAVLSIAFIMTSCQSNKNNSDTARFYDDGRSKPAIAIASVIDSTSYDVAWSLSDEFNYLVRNNLSKNSKLFLASGSEVDPLLGANDNPFATDISWMKDRYNPSEFIVFLELIKHDEESLGNAVNLDMTMRLRIIDIRSGTPKVILQEAIDDSYYISKGSIQTDYNVTTWGSDEFAHSRMGMAHKQLAKEIVDRINDYIILSKSR